MCSVRIFFSSQLLSIRSNGIIAYVECREVFRRAIQLQIVFFWSLAYGQIEHDSSTE